MLTRKTRNHTATDDDQGRSTLAPGTAGAPMDSEVDLAGTAAHPYVVAHHALGTVRMNSVFQVATLPVLLPLRLVGLDPGRAIRNADPSPAERRRARAEQFDYIVRQRPAPTSA